MWSNKKGVTENLAFLLGPTGKFNIRWRSTTAKPYIFATDQTASNNFVKQIFRWY